MDRRKQCCRKWRVNQGGLVDEDRTGMTLVSNQAQGRETNLEAHLEGVLARCVYWLWREKGNPRPRYTSIDEYYQVVRMGCK